MAQYDNLSPQEIQRNIDQLLYTQKTNPRGFAASQGDSKLKAYQAALTSVQQQASAPQGAPPTPTAPPIGPVPTNPIVPPQPGNGFTPPQPGGGGGLQTSLNQTVPSGPQIPGAIPGGTDISQYIPGLSQQENGLIQQAIAQAQGITQQSLPGISTTFDQTQGQQSGLVGQALGNIRGVQDTGQSSVTDLLNNYTQNYASRLGPNGDLGQQLAGEYNNLGITPGSGAFQQGLGNAMGALGGQNALTLGTEALLPGLESQYGALGTGLSSQLGTSSDRASALINSIMGGTNTQQGLASGGANIQTSLAQDPLQRYINQQDFQQQAQLSNQLAAQGASTSFGGGAGSLIGGGLGAGLGGIFGGPAGAGIGAMVGSGGGKGIGQAAGGTWICTHLKDLGLATQEEVEGVHKKLYTTIVLHPLAWLHYWKHGPELIKRSHVDWSEWKPLFIDNVLLCENREKAFYLYKEACHQLCMQEAPDLWPNWMLDRRTSWQVY